MFPGTGVFALFLHPLPGHLDSLCGGIYPFLKKMLMPGDEPGGGGGGGVGNGRN